MRQPLIIPPRERRGRFRYPDVNGEGDRTSGEAVSAARRGCGGGGNLRNRPLPFRPHVCVQFPRQMVNALGRESLRR